MLNLLKKDGLDFELGPGAPGLEFGFSVVDAVHVFDSRSATVPPFTRMSGWIASGPPVAKLWAVVVAARRMSAATQLLCEHEALSEEPEQPGFLSIRGDDFYCPSISRRRASGADFPKKRKRSQKSSKY